MRLDLALCLLVTLAVLAPCPTRADDDAPAHPEDLARIEQVGALRPFTGDANDLEARLDALGSADEPRDTGFGGRRRRFRLPGRSLSIWVDVVSFRGDVAAVGVQTLGVRRAWVEAARRHWNAIEVAQAAIRSRYADADVIGCFRGAIQAALGGAPEAEVPEHHAADYRLLTDPVADLVFGTTCFEAGVPPPGREAIDRLRNAGAVQHLGQVLRGMNPEGRLYAAQALLQLAAEDRNVPTRDREAIAKLRAMPTLIEACGGCIMYTATADDLLEDADD
jgi:hypothetical protein